MFGDFLLEWNLGSRTAWQLSPGVFPRFSLHDECLDSLPRTWVRHLVARSRNKIFGMYHLLGYLACMASQNGIDFFPWVAAPPNIRGDPGLMVDGALRRIVPQAPLCLVQLPSHQTLR